MSFRLLPGLITFANRQRYPSLGISRFVRSSSIYSKLSSKLINWIDQKDLDLLFIVPLCSTFKCNSAFHKMDVTL